MAVLESCPKHNMVAYLEKTDGNAEFHEIIDFLTRSSIHYALTVSPVISTTFVEQFWTSAKSQTINNVRYINAKVAGKPVTISEASIRSDLHFNDVDGIDSLNNQAIFDAIKLMRPLFPNMLVQLTEDEGEGSERPSEPQPTPSPPDPSKAHVKPQSDLSPGPSPTIHIPYPIPEGSGGNLGSQSQLKLQKTVKRKNQHKKKVLKTSKRRSVFKQGRKTIKSSKGAPTVPTNTEWDDLDMDIDDTIDYTLAPDEGKTDKFTIKERAKFLHDTFAAQRMFLAEQRAAAIRNRPPIRTQLRSQMMTYLKHSFIVIGSTEDERKIKEMNGGASDPDKKKKFVKEDVSTKVSSPDGDYLVIYRANGNFRAFNYQLERLEDGTVIHILVERRYPLSKELLQRMLDFGLEVEVESTDALDLISWASPGSNSPGKDDFKRLITNSSLKTIWISCTCYGNEALASLKANELTIPEQMATGKGISNLFMAGLPTTRSFLITNFSKIAKPLTSLTQKNQKYVWGVEQEKAFQTLKNNLCEAPILSLPDRVEDFVVYCDDSNQGLANVMADALNRKKQVKPKRARAMAMTIQSRDKELTSKAFRLIQQQRYLNGSGKASPWTSLQSYLEQGMSHDAIWVIDGNSESIIQTLEDMLRACVELLVTVGMSPMLWAKIGEGSLIGPELVQFDWAEIREGSFKTSSQLSKKYKITSTIITNRIKEGLEDVVSDNQSDFVLGRRISDNILITQELMHNYHLNRGPPRCGFKVDIQKAYDTVDWSFLKAHAWFPLVWWSMKHGKSKVAEVVCLPKHEGGLGIRYIGFTLINSKVVAYRMYLFRSNICWGWRKILQIFNVLRPHIWYCIGNGKTTSVWDDLWDDLCLLIQHVTPRNLIGAGFNRNNKVADVLKDGNWSWPNDWAVTHPTLFHINPPLLVLRVKTPLLRKLKMVNSCLLVSLVFGIVLDQEVKKLHDFI
ncbi:xylulose kinase-1 [Tanacetum coccineum]